MGPALSHARFLRPVRRRMADKVLLVHGRRARALDRRRAQLHRRRCALRPLLGRIEDQPFLHFEVCYYQAIDFAFARGLARVEAGAQGEHKLARGYLPCATYSRTGLPTPASPAPSPTTSSASAPRSSQEIEVLTSYEPPRLRAGRGPSGAGSRQHHLIPERRS